MKQINNIEEFENKFDNLFGKLSLTEQADFFAAWWFNGESNKSMTSIYKLISSVPEKMLPDVETFIEYLFEGFWSFINYSNHKIINLMEIEDLMKIREIVIDKDLEALSEYMPIFVYVNEKTGGEENLTELLNIIVNRIMYIKFDNDID